MRARSMLLTWVLAAACARESTPADAAATRVELRWRAVTSADQLSVLATEAHRARKALLLDVRAQWCVPCKQLEAETFEDPAVEAMLAERFVLARLDVTDPGPAAEALQTRLGAESMPKLLLWSMSPADAEAFAKGEFPPAARTISTFVAAAEFLPVLRAI